MFGRRSDGTIAQDIDPFLRVTSAFMPHRYDAMVNYLLECRCDAIDKFIREEGEKGHTFSYMHIVIAAIVRLYATRPQVNRFVMNTRVYNRKGIFISFAVKKSLTEESEETAVKLEFDGTENIYQIKEKINKAILANKGQDKQNGTDKFVKVLLKCPPFLLNFTMGLIRFLDKHGMVPKWAIKLSPFHTSCFLTNMKSISTEYVYHHIYDLGTTGMFVGLGKEVVKPVVNDAGEIEKAKVLQCGVVIDERICDGFYYAKSIKFIKKCLLNPEILTQNYEYPPKQLTKKELKKQQKQQKKLEKKQKRLEKNKKHTD